MCAGILTLAQLLFGVHQLARIVQRRLGIDGGLALFVLDRHEAGSVLGCLLALRHDGRDRLPVEDGAVERQRLARAREAIGRDERQVTRDVDADDARHRTRGLRVDPHDAGVGIGAEH